MAEYRDHPQPHPLKEHPETGSLLVEDIMLAQIAPEGKAIPWIVIYDKTSGNVQHQGPPNKVLEWLTIRLDIEQSTYLSANDCMIGTFPMPKLAEAVARHRERLRRETEARDLRTEARLMVERASEQAADLRRQAADLEKVVF